MSNRLTSVVVFTILSCYVTTAINAQVEKQKQHFIKAQTIIQPSTDVDSKLRDYSIFSTDDLVSPKKMRTNDQIQLELGGHSFSLKVYTDNLIVESSIQGNRQLIGGVSNDGGLVSLTLSKDFIYGFIEKHGVRYYIQPLYYFDKKAKSDQFILFKEEDVREEHEKTVCGHSLKGAAPFHAPTKSLGNGCRIMKFAVANTYDMLQKYGSSQAVLNHNLGVMNNVQTDFRSEFDINIEFEFAAFYIANSTSQEPFSSNSTSNDASLLLPAFSDWASDGNGGLPGGTLGGFETAFDLAAVWTARNITQGSNSIIGLAYTPGWFQILEDHTASASRLQTLMTHETGHNLSAQHDPAGSTNIMAPATASTSEWSSSSSSAISSYLNQLNYLATCSTQGNPIAAAFQSSLAICQGSTVVFEDQSRYGECSDWTFENANLTNSDLAKPSVSFNQTGYNLVHLTSTNAAGQDSYTTFVNVQDEPNADCSPPSHSGTGGIKIMTLNNLTQVTGLAQDEGSYINLACEGTATLETSTTYDLRITLEGITYINFYYDYNNDGDFSDANESDTGYFLNSDGSYLIPLTTPATVLMNTILRMRIVTSSTQISGPCFDPTNGQVEDYGIFFYTEQILGCTDPSSSNYNPEATIDDGSCTGGNGNMTTWYRDLDGDSFGNPNITQSASTQPSGYVEDNTDCNDSNPNINPDANEICDGLDNNCNGSADEGLNLSTYYRDLDNDGYGNIQVTLMACALPNGYETNSLDCDDNNAMIHPGINETCDGLDNNCNGSTDEGLIETYYRDIDEDGYGDINTSIVGCTKPNGFVANNEDCNDNNSLIFPGSIEICDGIDNNCNGAIDDGAQPLTFYEDNDGDGYGTENNTFVGCEAPLGFVELFGDCDDNNAFVNPEGTEICDGLDNDCDNSIDEDINFSEYYQDNDGDNYGNIFVMVTACEQPSGYVLDSNDCDDEDANINPDAPETCDGLDNNCNGMHDEGINYLYYFQDNDGDGFGNEFVSIEACSQPNGYVLDSSDCDDENEAINPNVPETCDGLDNNCNGIQDEGVSSQNYYQDYDGDGFGNEFVSIEACSQPIGYVLDSSDCDDENPNINPNTSEICDGSDNNCDGNIDEGAGNNIYYYDNDGDGYGNTSVSLEACTQPLGYVQQSGDCNDENPNINPAANDICDGIDNNCNGLADEFLNHRNYYKDNDGDGYGNADLLISSCENPSGYVTNNGDCDDTNPNINPSAPENCDGIDNNCNGTSDEGLSNNYYQDNDGDGYGNSSLVIMSCEKPIGYAILEGDCDDGNPSINPEAEDVCDGLDNNCNGLADEFLNHRNYFKDNDGDGFGNSDELLSTCQQPIGYVTNGNDCDDTNPSIHPGAVELCNDVDHNCDGSAQAGVSTQTYYLDADLDGYGNDAISINVCAQPTGYVLEAGDCNDNNPTINPGSDEACDEVDNNCNGIIDESNCNIVEGQIWEDSNGSGQFDNAEKGLAGLVIQLISSGRSIVIAETTTDDNGYYEFTEIPNGNYSIQIGLEQLSEFVLAFENSDYFIEEDFLTSVPFTLNNKDMETPGISFYEGGNMGGSLFYEDNQGAIQTWVYLYKMYPTIELIDSMYTDINGDYLFNKIKMGTYFLEFLAPYNENFLMGGAGAEETNEVIDIFFDEANNSYRGRTEPFQVYPGQSFLTINGVVSEGSSTLSTADFQILKASWSIAEQASVLTWDLATIDNISKLSVQRSNNVNQEFIEFGSVKEFSFTGNIFLDHPEKNGIYYYRLNKELRSGESVYSSIASVNVVKEKPNLKIYPNPTSNLINILLPNQAGAIDISIVDKRGKLVEKIQKKQNNNGLITLDLNHLMPGIYYAKILSGAYVYNDKIAIVR